MTDKIVVLCTCGSVEEAEAIAQRLIESRVAACVNVLGGVRSFYRWRGAIENAAELLLIIKSSRDRFEALRVEIERLHSYEIPEIVALPLVDGSANYLSWLEGELRE